MTRRPFGTIITRKNRQGDAISIQARYPDPVRPGRKVQRQFHPDDLGDALRWLDEERYLVRLHRKGIAVWTHPTERQRREEASKLTLKEYVDREFLPRYRKPDGSRLRPAAQRNLECDCRHFTESRLGGMKAADITAEDVREWLEGEPVAGPWAFHRAARRLKAVFRSMTTEQPGRHRIRDDSPFVFPIPRPPDPARMGASPLTVEEASRLAAAMPERYRLSIWLSLLVGGLRIGEVCALQRRDIDLDARRLYVRHSAVRGEGDCGTVRLGDTKTRASRRVLPIPSVLVPAIRRHLAEWCAEGDEAMVFPPRRNPSGVLSPTTLSANFRRARRAAGREDLTFHALRSTHATMLVLRGASLREAMDQLGHTSVEVAVRHYQLVVPDHRAAVVDLLGVDFLAAPAGSESLDLTADTAG